jgi:HEXXH motif-containing protein
MLDTPEQHGQSEDLGNSADPWSWRPDNRAWFRALGPQIDAWTPDASVIPDAQPIRMWLHDCARRGVGALMHPCISALTDPSARSLVQRDIQLAVWAASLVAEPRGHLRVPSKLSSQMSELWLWTADGGLQVPPGPHALADLAQVTGDAAAPVPVALDVWCHCLGHVLPESWGEIDDLTTADAKRLHREAGFFSDALQWATSAAPTLLAWIAAVTRVVVPLRQRPGVVWSLRSGSTPKIPGLIHCDLFGGEVEILEALVRESAHRHLYLAEANGPLVDPAPIGASSSNPRWQPSPEPRPLRDVILDAHALAYVCRFYRDAIRTELAAQTSVGRHFEQQRRGLRESIAIVERDRYRLTDHGARFVERLLEVARS